MARFSSYILCVHIFVLVCSSLVSGGIVRIASESEEAYALRMWRDMCQNGRRDSAQDENNNAVYCAQDEDTAAGIRSTVEVVHPTIKLPSQRNTPANQIIVVEPPATHFRHQINIEADASPAPKTTIYVRPSADKHQLEIIQQRDGNSPPPKPTILFLGQNGNVDSEARVSGGGDGGSARILSSSSSTDYLQLQGSEVVEQKRRIQQDKEEEGGDQENLVGKGQSFTGQDEQNTKTGTGNGSGTLSSVSRFSSSSVNRGDQAATTGRSVTVTGGKQDQDRVEESSTGNQDQVSPSATQSQINVVGGRVGQESFGQSGERNGFVGVPSSVSVIRIAGAVVPSNDGNGNEASSSSQQSNSGNEGALSSQQSNSGLVSGNQGQEEGSSIQGSIISVRDHISRIGSSPLYFASGVGNDDGARIENGRLVEQPGIQESISQSSIATIGSSPSSSSVLLGQETSPVIEQESGPQNSNDDAASKARITYSVRYGDNRSPSDESYQIGQVDSSLSGESRVPSYQSYGNERVIGSSISQTGGVVTSDFSGLVVGQQYPTTTTDYISGSRYASGSLDYSQGLEAANNVADIQAPSSSSSVSSSQERITSSSSTSSSSATFNPARKNDYSSFSYSANNNGDQSAQQNVGVATELTTSSQPVIVVASNNDKNQEGQQRRGENGQARRQRRKKQRGGRQGQGQQNVDPNGDATSSVFFEMDHSEMMHYSVRHPY